MATLYWQGGAAAVAQISNGSIDSVDGTPANNTFHVTIGDIAVSQVGDTDVATTAAALVVKLEASTHPYFAAVTWTNPSAGNVTGTADTAGAPFVAVLTETGAGTGAVTDFSDTTAATGPNHWNEAQNWSTGAVPVNSDDVIIKESSISIRHGLAQSAVDSTSLFVEQSFTAKLGLESPAFATSSDGDTTDSTAPEYRATHLDIGADVIEIGQHFGPGAPSGSSLIKIDNDKSGASNLIVHNSGQTANISPAIHYLAAHANADIDVRLAPGGIGVAVDRPGETATVGDIVVSATVPTSSVFVGEGVTWTSYSQSGGDNKVAAATDTTAVTVDGGSLELTGSVDYTIATMTINGGAVTDLHDDAAAIITTLNMNDGTLDLASRGEARTITTCNFKGGSILVDDDDVTISSAFIGTATGKRTVTVEPGV